MAALTLLEIAKTMDEQRGGIIGTYATMYHPMTVLPVINEPTGVHKWTMENQLPYTTGGVRNFNGSWTRTYGTNSPKSETIRIYGGSFQIDRQLAKINPNSTSDQKLKQIEADARQFTIDFFEGSDGTELRGLEDILDNDSDFTNQTVDCGSSTSAAVLSTDIIDKWLAKHNVVPGRTYIYSTSAITRMFRKLSRGSITSSNTNYNLVYSPEQFGYFSGMYDEIPIITLVDGAGSDMLTTTRATSADGSSIYCVTFGENDVTGFQSSNADVYPLNDDTVYNFFDYEWPVGVAVKSKRCISRLRYVKNDVT